jgi:1-acyl-sn-glycerol-3-phosphate acyltransferase
VIKPAAARNPFFRGPVRACDYITNEDGVGLIDDCVAAVRAGGNLIIFPEGTRSVPGQPLRLQRGAARIAVRGGLNITPVHIDCSPPTLAKGQKWYHIPPRRFHMRIEVGEDLAIGPYLMTPHGAMPENRAARRLTQYLAGYFSAPVDQAHELEAVIE